MEKSQGLASYCKAETTFTFHFSILTLSSAFLSINNTEMKSESGFSLAMASHLSRKRFTRFFLSRKRFTHSARKVFACWILPSGKLRLFGPLLKCYFQKCFESQHERGLSAGRVGRWTEAHSSFNQASTPSFYPCQLRRA